MIIYNQCEVGLVRYYSKCNLKPSFKFVKSMNYDPKAAFCASLENILDPIREMVQAAIFVFSDVFCEMSYWFDSFVECYVY